MPEALRKVDSSHVAEAKYMLSVGSSKAAEENKVALRPKTPEINHVEDKKVVLRPITPELKPAEDKKLAVLKPKTADIKSIEENKLLLRPKTQN
uniref:Uncharacterized protein n=1 Tax=Ditylenchus dipsaci TaxID=166011 RepID=A0A915CP94_9BILA